MQKQLYPAEFVEDSIERHVSRHSRRSQAIYVAVLLLLVGALAALPLVRVGVSVRSAGILRPVTEKQELTAGAAGFAEDIRARVGQSVRRGDVLLALRAAPLEERLDLTAAQLGRVRDEAADLELLTGTAAVAGLDPRRFRTARYRQEHAQIGDELRENELREARARTELERSRELASRGLAPRTELEDREFQLSQVRAERGVLVERAQSRWQASLAAARAELRELESRREQLREERALYSVTAPVDGTVEELAPVAAGAFVQAGQKLAVISPASEIVAEVYVPPRDIGLLGPGTPVRLLVDAFNYNDWGVVTGRVEEISDDFLVVNQKPVFRVRVALDQSELRLRNGFRGRLRKGMTLQARFMVAERTLFQLLRDDVNDWLNPVHSPLAVQPGA